MNKVPKWRKSFLSETAIVSDTKIIDQDGSYLILYQGQIVNDSKLVIEMNTQLWINGLKTKAMVTNIMPKMHYGIPFVCHIASLKAGDRVEIRHFVDLTSTDIPTKKVFLIMDELKHTFVVTKLGEVKDGY